jgi:ABC-2 type transport system permease protein
MTEAGTEEVVAPVRPGATDVVRTESKEPVGRTGAVLAWELEKLCAQTRVRIAFIACLLGPFAFAVALTLTDSVPADTLFGRWVGDSGLAIPLVVLGFAASWGFPILTCLVAGDIFASEDVGGTWPILLTRSCGRGTLFTGKVLATFVYVVAALVVLGVSSLAAGLVVAGRQPLVGLSGNLIQPGHAAGLVLLSWLSVVPPCLAFAALGMLLSVLTRNSVASVVGAVVLGMGMQFGTLVDGIGVLRDLMLGTHFLAWHVLFMEPYDAGPIRVSSIVSLGYAVVCLTIAWLVLRCRDMTGA